MTSTEAKTIASYTGKRLRDIVGHDRPTLSPYELEQVLLEAPYSLAARLKSSVNDETNMVRVYLDSLPQAYRNKVVNIAERLPPMKPQCLLSINMPVRNEEKAIYSTLKQMLIDECKGEIYLAQKEMSGRKLLAPETYEVTILVNNPMSSKKPDDSLRVIERFMENYKNLPLSIYVLDVKLPDNIANIGMARKLIQDVTLYRSLARPSCTGLLTIGSEDADIDYYDSRTFDTYRQNCSEMKHVSSLRLTLERNYSILKQVQYLYKKHLFEESIANILTSKPFSSASNTNFKVKYNMYRPNGSGTAYAASSLAAAGGHPISRRAEDILLGEQIAVARGCFVSDHHFRIKTDCVVRSPLKLVASPRRILASYITETTDWHADYFFNYRKEQLVRTDINKLIEIALSRNAAASKEDMSRSIESCREKLLYTLPPSLTEADVTNLINSAYHEINSD